MLTARRTNVTSHRYEISAADGTYLAAWGGSLWKRGGPIELDGQRYTVRGNAWGSKFAMVTEDETQVAWLATPRAGIHHGCGAGNVGPGQRRRSHS